MKEFALAFGWSIAGIFAIAVAGTSNSQLTNSPAEKVVEDTALPVVAASRLALQ